MKTILTVNKNNAIAPRCIEQQRTFGLRSIYLSICFIICLASFWNVKAWARSNDEIEVSAQEKIYVNPDQIEVTVEGIFFYDHSKESIILAEILSHDENGLYIQPKRGPCNLHNEWCKYCKGCGVLYCPMKCQCPYGGGG